MNLAGVAGLFLVKAAVVWALSDVPTNENFIARAQVTATVLGNFVYIDGGRVWQIDPDPVLNGFIFAMNSTISIDLTKTWTSRSVALRTIPKPPEIASRCKGHVWTDTGSNGSFYSWGGYWGVAARERVDETPRLYKFTADGNGGGNWSIVPSEEISPFGVLDTLHPAEAGAFATTSDGVGFVIGGKATPWTEKSRQRLEINGTRAHQMVPGMLSFDIKTKTFHNTSSSPALSGETNEHNAIISAVAHYVPGYGKNGVIVLLGGVASPVDKDVDAKFSEPIGFRNLTFFDPVTKESFWQMTSGEEPESPRTFFCAVGFDAGDGRYDILFFGGQNEERDLYYADAWVLSLPGFVWTRLENIPDEWAPGGRGMHSCVRVGKRQVLIIGGLFKSDRDPVPQGLLLFDHMSGGYGLRYEPNDEPYQSPSNVKAFYEKG
ncbi:hypothetical protein QBC35DRAFT_383805 [Podospora australis]|uniref:Kelch repeat-containing protein n=1 Tax=Podospora australis TaxID=1536484 RepID=A0AAN7AJ40_9PEZI|nr:hypothetical protein QBC35DRAFT_383805 [Podospora australis]